MKTYTYEARVRRRILARSEEEAVAELESEPPHEDWELVDVEEHE